MGPLPILVALSSPTAEQCTQTHYLADGRVVVTKVDAPNGAQVSVSSHSQGRSSSSSSVSASSSSRGDRYQSSSSSTSDGNGRTVSVQRDRSGCTVTIDDRPRLHQQEQ